MNEHRSTSALREALRSLHGSPHPTESLHDCVRAFTADAKLADWPVESVIVAVKHMAVEAGFNPPRVVVASADEIVVTSVVRWCIDSYYPPE
jgi:hypothetical protein